MQYNECSYVLQKKSSHKINYLKGKDNKCFVSKNIGCYCLWLARFGSLFTRFLVSCKYTLTADIQRH